MHVSTANRITEELNKTMAVLRENKPKEAVKKLRNLAREMKANYARKPISKKGWNNLWSSVLGDFIMCFEANAVDYDAEKDGDPNEEFLRGIAKGMWAIFNMIEELMVREK